jgi:putative NADH-flavin reductase
MRLIIVASTGGIGRELVRQAVRAGHDVTGVARNPQTPDAVRADLSHPDPGLLEATVKGADAVLSGLGARTRADEGVATRGTAAVIAAMVTTGVRRLVVVSAAPLGTVPSPARPHPPRHDPGDGFFMRHLGARFAKTMFGTHYADLAGMEDEVFASGLDWTVARPPKLDDKPLTGHYRTALDQNVRGGFAISRADVAHAMLQCLDRPETIGHVVGMAR